MANLIVLNPQAGDSIALTGVASAYNQPNAFAQIGVTVYSTASIPANAGNALYGKSLVISGFASAGNNGTFLVLSSTATTITTNNSNGVVVSAAGTAAFAPVGTPAGYASKIENLWTNQNDDSVTVNANVGDCLVAVAIGLKSYDPFDLIHGASTALGFIQGLNDFNANPTISDGATVTPAVATSAAVVKNAFVVTEANGTATIAGTAAAADTSSAATSVQITSNVLTVTAVNDFLVGEVVTLSDFTGAGNTFLNGQTVTVLSSPGPGTSFTAAFTHANYGPASETTGIATGNLLTVTFATPTGETIAVGQNAYLEGTQEAVLNGQTFTILSTDAATTFSANYTGASFTNAVDTGSFLTSNTNGSYVLAGTFTGGAANAFAGYYFSVAGFAHSQNNGTFLCTASSVAALTLTNASGGIGEVAAASATDYVLTILATNTFTVGEVVALAGFTNAAFLNGQQVKIVTRTGSQFTANYPNYNENYGPATEPTGATASAISGNTWTLAVHVNIADSDPTTPSYTTSSQWNLDGYYPSIYIWTAPNVEAGSYKVKLNSMYQAGIDYPTDYAQGSYPIFDGGVTFQVYSLSGAATSAVVEASSISSVSTATNPATAPATLTVANADGDAIISVGLQKSGNVLAPGSIGGTPTSLVLSAVAPLLYGTGTQYPPQNYGGAVYTGTITGGANNALVGNTFTVAGFVNAVNNGVFVCTGSTATTLTLLNGNAIAETHAGTAAYTPLMTRIGGGKLVGSEAHYLVEYYATPGTGTFNPGFANPLGYNMLVGSVAIKSS